MPRDCRVYLDDILEAIGKIDKYCLGLSYKQLIDDNKSADAIIRNLEVIGEAVKKKLEV
jgi:uncharacterized protein with HEPN domain